MSDVMAPPSVRALAREKGIDLEKLARDLGRTSITRDDVVGGRPPAGGAGDTSYWDVDHSQFGPVTEEPMSRFARVAAANLAAANALVPQVTHHDRADVTAIESLRKALKPEAEFAPAAVPAREAFPAVWNLQLAKTQDMRYGENPHQAAAFYRDAQPAAGTLAQWTQIQGKALSYNNIADADAAWECVKSFDVPACVIVKHANPCGVALGTSPREAYDKAFQTDPTSAFGGIIA